MENAFKFNINDILTDDEHEYKPVYTIRADANGKYGISLSECKWTRSFNQPDDDNTITIKLDNSKEEETEDIHDY